MNFFGMTIFTKNFIEIKIMDFRMANMDKAIFGKHIINFFVEKL